MRLLQERLAVVGSRTINDYALIFNCLDSLNLDIRGLVCGRARGPDLAGDAYATYYWLPVYYFPALWKKYGMSAGMRRNIQLINFSTGVVAFWDGQSRGTKHAIAYAKAKSKLLHVFMV